MNAPLAAMLICLCLQAQGLRAHAADQAAATPGAPMLVATATPADAAAPRTRNEVTTATMGPAATPSQHRTAPPEPPETGARLLLVGVALMIGIALRRWAMERR